MKIPNFKSTEEALLYGLAYPFDSIRMKLLYTKYLRCKAIHNVWIDKKVANNKRNWSRLLRVAVVGQLCHEAWEAMAGNKIPAIILKNFPKEVFKWQKK